MAFVLVDDPFADHRVDFGYGFLIEAGGLLGISGSGGFLDFLDGRAHARPQGHVVLPAAFSLAGPLGGRFDICQLLVLFCIDIRAAGL